MEKWRTRRRKERTKVHGGELEGREELGHEGEGGQKHGDGEVKEKGKLEETKYEKNGTRRWRRERKQRGIAGGKIR